LKVFKNAQLPEASEKVDEKEVVLDDDEDARDMALFRHSITTETPTSSDGAALTAEPSIALPEQRFGAQDYEPSSSTNILPSHLQSRAGVAHIRHLSIAPAYASKAGVVSHILDLAVRSTFTTTAEVDKLVMVVSTKLDKGLRRAALRQGFKVVGKVTPSMENPDMTQTTDTIEKLLKSVWPLSFTNEVLLLDKSAWQSR